MRSRHLDLVFDKELKNMKIFCFSKVKQRKYKKLSLSLSAIKECHKEALLAEYYKMCSLVQ